MRIWDFSRSAFGICAVGAMLAACGGSQPPIGAPGAMPQSPSITTYAAHRGSWVLPEAASEDLLYVSDVTGVHVFSSEGNARRGFNGFAEPQGLCTDRAGDIFVTDALAFHVYEFAHGGAKPIAVFYDNHVDFNPENCSVDPVTGDLAVAIPDLPSVVIFPDAKQKPVVYSDPYSIIFWCAYDNKVGNLFTERVRHHGRFYIGELPKGASSFKNLLLDPRVGDPSDLQFDGQHMVVEDLDGSMLYRLRFSGGKAIDIGNTPLNGAKQIEQFWIHKNKVIGPDSYGPAYFWKYPLGGSPVKSIPGFPLPVGVTVSLAPH